MTKYRFWLFKNSTCF